MEVNPVQVERFLSGMDYPASKNDLVNYASSQGADDNVINTLEQMPGDNFNSVKDVSRAIGEIE